MKSAPIAGPLFFAAATCLPAQLPQVVTEAPRIQFTETRAELKELIPGLGELQPDIGDDARAIKDTFEFRGHKFGLKYGFQRGRLYAWNALASGLSHEATINLADALVPLFEKRFGPSVREVILPGESDGPPQQVSTNFSWKVNGFPLVLGMSHSPASGTISFGSQKLGWNGGDCLRVVSTAGGLQVEVVSHHGHRGVYRVEELPTNEEAVFVLSELARRGVTGTLSNRPLQPPDYGQEIAASGGRNQKARTYSLDGFRLVFPITVFRRLPNGTELAETHFGIDSLFPGGLRIGDKEIDLKRYGEWRAEMPERPDRDGR